MNSSFKFIQKCTDTEIYLNGQKLYDVKGFKFSAECQSISTVLLEIRPSEIEIESDSFRLTTENFSMQDLLNTIVNESSNHVANKMKSNLNFKKYIKCNSPECIHIPESQKLDPCYIFCPFCNYSLKSNKLT